MSNDIPSDGRTKSVGIRVSSLVLLAILAITALGSGGLYARASSSVSYSNVQINIQTAADLPYSFVVSAYNSTGSLVAYTQTNFAAAAFELPAGTYLFTVTAYHYIPSPCDVCMEPVASSQSQTLAGGTMIPSPIGAPEVEYGYSVQHVNGLGSFTIKTQNTTSIATADVNVKVSYANGTAASGAHVSAFVMGQSYYYWGDSATISMSDQTDVQGVAQLVVPAVPVEVSSSISVPVILPQNETAVQTTIDGQRINVTVYWQPMDVTLSASALIIPPQTSASIVLQYRQPCFYYYPTPYATPAVTNVGGSTSGITTASQGSGTASTPSSGQVASTHGQSAPASKISPFNMVTSLATTDQSSQTSNDSAVASQDNGNAENALLLGLATAAVMVVTLATVFLARTRTKR